MIKNITPNQLAAYAAIGIGSIVTLLSFLGLVTGIVIAQWYHVLLIGLLTCIAAYWIILSILKRYIYRKIKLIYKSIHASKRSSISKSEVDINSDIIGEVEQEVSDWAASQQKEIDSLKSLEEYRRNFMGDISHELKTPIFSIQGYLYTLLDGGLYDEKINLAYIQKAAKNADRLQTIVEDLEAISRLESEEMLLDINTFDIRALCDEVYEELELSAKKSKIKLIYKEGASGIMMVKGDREAIRRVLVNLVSNSIKYGNKGGQTKVSFYDMDNHSLIEVADNGIGIPEESLKHLFDRFYRVDKSRSREQGGSGLGLSIVKHIIEAHRQTVNVRSTFNEGSTFGFTLEKGN